MKLSEVRDLHWPPKAKVGSYYRFEDRPGKLLTVRVYYIGLDEPEPNDTGTVTRFEFFKNDEKMYGEWYYEIFDAQATPATDEEIAEFLATEKRIGRKFLDGLKEAEQFPDVKVGSYYKLDGWDIPHGYSGVVKVTDVVMAEDGSVVEFEFYDYANEPHADTAYYDEFPKVATPATEEEIAQFKRQQKIAGRKFLDNLKNNDKE